MTSKPILRLAMVDFGQAITRSKDGDGINGGRPEGMFDQMMSLLTELFIRQFK